jgi:hypothetical protein
MDDEPKPCPDCGGELEFVECWACGGEGETAPGELYEEDPLWYDEDATEPCHQCGGRGGWPTCWTCVDREKRERMASASPAPGRGGEGT